MSFADLFGGSWRAWLAPALLLVLAGTQLALSSWADLSPWKGGGFGMFSTNDHGGFRTVRVIALASEDAAEERTVTLPSELDRLRRHVREIPRPANLLRLAAEARQRDPALGSLRVEVWRVSFDPETLEPRHEKMAEAASP